MVPYTVLSVSFLILQKLQVQLITTPNQKKLGQYGKRK